MNRPIIFTVSIVLSAWWFSSVVAADRAATRRDPAHPELALQYDFFRVEGGRVDDASKQDHAGRLQRGEVVYGRRKPAVKFDGQGLITLDDPANGVQVASRSLTVGALCNPAAADGVLVAVGDKTNGFSLYLKDAVPHFAVRTGGELFLIHADEPVVLGQWVHLYGALDADGQLWLVLNGWPKAHAPGRPIAEQPSESFTVGADPGAPVGEYASPLPWRGLMEDVRVYWGFLDRNEQRDELQDWADLPGCGCRK
jgi:hypothetical protein